MIGSNKKNYVKIPQYGQNCKIVAKNRSKTPLHPHVFYTKNKNLCPETILDVLTNKYSHKKHDIFCIFCQFILSKSP